MSEDIKNKHVPSNDSLEATGRVDVSHDPAAASDERSGAIPEWVDGAIKPYNGEWPRYRNVVAKTPEQMQAEQDAYDAHQRDSEHS